MFSKKSLVECLVMFAFAIVAASAAIRLLARWAWGRVTD